jgi:hypothetical protein
MPMQRKRYEIADASATVNNPPELTRSRRRFGLRLGSAAHSIEHFLAMNGHFRGSINSQPYFIAANFDHRNDDVIANDNPFVALSR